MRGSASASKIVRTIVVARVTDLRVSNVSARWNLCKSWYGQCNQKRKRCQTKKRTKCLRFIHYCLRTPHNNMTLILHVDSTSTATSIRIQPNPSMPTLAVGKRSGKNQMHFTDNFLAKSPPRFSGLTFALTGRRSPLQLNRLYLYVPVQRGC